jgi:hypothetical protein
MAKIERSAPPPGYRWVFCKSYRHRCGRVLVASDYGHDAWCFLVKN